MSSATIDAGSVAVLEQPQPGADFSSLVQTATLEFHASVQLLAERARFLTAADGVAIAAANDGKFVYCASVGGSVPEIGDVAILKTRLLHECNARMKPVSSQDGNSFFLAVPIARNRESLGFFQLVSMQAEFSQDDIKTVSRLADLAVTALEIREAAEQAEDRLLTPVQQERTAPLWHALEAAPAKLPQTAFTPKTAEPLPAIGACAWCGFPISAARRLCLDCEEKNPLPLPANDEPMFTFEKEESWLAAHGYTIATVLVSALAGVVIYLLR